MMKIKPIVKKILDILLKAGPCFFVVIWGLCALFYVFKGTEPSMFFLLSAVVGALFFVLIAPAFAGREYFEYLIIQVVLGIIILLIVFVLGIVAGAIWPSLSIPWRLR